MEVLQRTANRGSISTGYDIDNSIVFETANSERVHRNNGNTGQRRTFTISAWVKRTALGYHRTFGVGISGANQMVIYFKDTHEIVWYDYHGGSYSFNYKTNRLFRDTSAWYHLVFAVDTEQGTEANRVRLYVNGVEETSFATQTEPALNRETNWNYANGSKDVGNILNEAPFASCYMSEVYHINDQQLAPTDFGEFDDDTGIWKPKAFTGTFGGEDSYLNFDSSGSMGADSSGNSNDFTLQNITSADQATDTPTNNFATYNALLPNADLREGATRFFNHDAGADMNLSTIAVANGKWYAEFKTPSNIAGGNGQYGVHANEGSITDGRFIGQDAWSCGPMGGTNYYRIGNVNSSAYFSSTWGQNDVMSVALDMDNKKVYFAKNGTWGDSGNPANGTNGIALPSAYEDYEWFIGASLVLNTDTFNANYGGYTTITISSAASDANGYGTFEYAPPSGYYALCTKNLAEYG